MEFGFTLFILIVVVANSIRLEALKKKLVSIEAKLESPGKEYAALSIKGRHGLVVPSLLVPTKDCGNERLS
jgi:hypothetical protein